MFTVCCRLWPTLILTLDFDQPIPAENWTLLIRELPVKTTPDEALN